MPDQHVEETDRSALALGATIEAGRLDPVDLAEAMLSAIETGDPERRIFVRLLPERTRAEARAARDRARAGLRRGPLDGVPVAWKDNVATAGAVTAAGSRLLENHVPDRDAPVLARATAAGTVFLGKTNLTEIAFSGLGINPVTGTPANPHDPATPRVPGGSSSGTGVALARGLAPLGVGTDTGGSVRIPAAWNGVVGLKTTAGLVPTDGVVPLVPSLDTVGPMARSVAETAALHAVLAACPPPDLTGATLNGLPLLAVSRETLGTQDDAVWAAFEAALSSLEQAGARIVRAGLPALKQARSLAAKHRVPGVPEASAVWRAAIEARPDVMYRFVADRVDEAAPGSAEGWAGYLHDLSRLSRQIVQELAGYGAALWPTVASRPSAIADLEHDAAAYGRANRASLANTAPVNALGLCALSLPAGMIPASDGAPALPFGLQWVAAPGREAVLLRLASAAERLFEGPGTPSIAPPFDAP